MLDSKNLHYLSSTSIIITIGLVVVLLQALDISASNTWALKLSDRISPANTMVYTLITVISILIHVFFLVTTTKTFRSKKATSTAVVLISYIYILSHVLLIISLGYVLAEQLVISKYQIALVQLMIGLSFVISVLMTTSLAISCIKSSSSTKSRITGVYGLALLAISFQFTTAFFYIEYNLSSKPEYITPDRNPWASNFYTALRNSLSSVYEIAKLVSFVGIWLVSVLLTKSYVRKTRKIKYWTIVSIPLIYFSLQYSTILFHQLGTLSFLMMSEGSAFPYIYNLILNTANVGSGILLGVSFFIVSRSLMYEKLRYYLVLWGTGIMIAFSMSVSTFLVTYPAWGIISITFVLPASFLLLLGLDSATFYIASDMTIRGHLSKFRSQFEFLQSLGTRKASDTVEQRIQNISRQIHNNLRDQTLFTTATESEDFKQYVREVIAEIKRSEVKIDNTNHGDSSDDPAK